MMCGPILPGICKCKGTARLVCACGICQYCGRTINESTLLKKNNECSPQNDQDDEWVKKQDGKQGQKRNKKQGG
jgi:hypothetical protein